MGTVAWFLGRLRIPTFNQLYFSLPKSQLSKGVLSKTFILWFCERSDEIFVPWRCIGPHTFSLKLNLSGYYSVSFYFQSLGLHQIIVHLPQSESEGRKIPGFNILSSFSSSETWSFSQEVSTNNFIIYFNKQQIFCLGVSYLAAKGLSPYIDHQLNKRVSSTPTTSKPN